MKVPYRGTIASSHHYLRPRPRPPPMSSRGLSRLLSRQRPGHRAATMQISFGRWWLTRRILAHLVVGTYTKLSKALRRMRTFRVRQPLCNGRWAIAWSVDCRCRKVSSRYAWSGTISNRSQSDCALKWTGFGESPSGSRRFGEHVS